LNGPALSSTVVHNQ